MVTTPTAPKRAVSLLPLRNAIWDALVANSTIHGLIDEEVFRVSDVTSRTRSYLVITILTYVPDNTYTSTRGTAHVQITAVSFDSPDDADALSAAAATALVDTPWTIPGFDLLDARQAPKPPDATPVDREKVVWEERERYEFIIRSQQ